MGLINEQQEKKAKVKTPEAKPLPAYVQDIASQMPQIPGQDPIQAPAQPTTQASPLQAPSVQTDASFSAAPPQPQQDVTKASTDAGVEFSSPNAPILAPEMTQELPPQQPGDIPYYQPFPVDVPAPRQANITPTPSILSDVTQEAGKGAAWNPTIVNNKLPSVYISTPDLSGTYNQGLQDLGAAVTGYNQKAADAYANANRQLEQIRKSTPNVPEQEKNWFTQGLDYLRDVTFGSKKAQEAANRGEWTDFFNPDLREGSYGRAGAGLLGAGQYVLGTLGNVAVGAIAEGTEKVAENLERFGVPKERARAFAERGGLSLIPGDPFKQLQIVGFNWEEAIKRNSVVDAIRGDQVNVIQGGKETTEAGVGRVFYNPRLKPGQSGWSDPLGVAVQLGTFIFNPGDTLTEDIIGRGIGKLFGVGGKKAPAVVGKAPVGSPSNPEVLMPAPTRPALPETTKPVQVVDAEFVFPTYANKPAAANPTKVTRVELGQTNVNRKLLPPAIEPELVPARSTPVLPPSSPAHTALEISIGKPSTLPITDPGQLVIRSYPDMVQTIQQRAPKLLEEYNGVTWQQLKSHLSQQGVDVSQFNAVGADLRALPPAKVDEALDVVKPGETSVNIDVPQSPVTEVKTYADVLTRLGANTSEPTDLEEIASILQEMAVKQGLKAGDVRVDELLPKAVEEFNNGKRVNLGTSTIVKQYSQKEFDDVGFDISKLIANVEKRGIKLTGNEDPRVLDITLQELQKSDANVERIQKLLDNGDIKVYDNVDDIPRFTGKDLFSHVKSRQTPVNTNVPKPLTNDDLLTAAEELASQKLTIEANLNQLEDIFNTTVDYGRRATNDLGLRPTTTDEVLSVITNGGKPNLHPSIADLPGGQALLRADLNELMIEGARQGLNPRQLVEAAVNKSNEVLSLPTPVNRALTKSPVGLTKLPRDLYHGTALEGWQPAYNLSVNGSRGELGHGLYLTRDVNVARDYARARMGENVSPATLDMNLAPSVYKVNGQLTSTLDARAKIPNASDFWKQLADGLPGELQKALNRSLSRSKDNTYTGFLNKLESAMPKAGIDPSETSLQQMQKIVSDNLRRLGYDSVYDNKSGFAVALDESTLKAQKALDVPAAVDGTESALARYNADAYAAKFYGDRLSTDANLRDSAAKLLRQLHANVDNKLSEVQEQLMMRKIGDTESVLPKAPEPTNAAPKTTQELMQTIDNLVDDLCNL